MTLRFASAVTFKEHAHNGLATALWDGVFLYRLGTLLRGLCAFKEHAHNGLATALRDGVFLYRLGTLLRGLCALLIAAALQAQEAEADKLAPYYPTPESVVRRMLDLGELKASEKMFDLGSGDGRLVIAAARDFKADGTGVELDADLWKQSTDRIKKLKLEKTARVIQGDLLKQDYSSADLITVYLLPHSIDDQLTPILEKQLKKGARIVSHDFEFSKWKPVKTIDIDDDGEGRSHRIFLYRR